MSARYPKNDTSYYSPDAMHAKVSKAMHPRKGSAKSAPVAMSVCKCPMAPPKRRGPQD